MIKKINSITDPRVFWPSNFLIALLIIFSITSGDLFVKQIEALKSSLLVSMSWAYILPIIWLIIYVLKIYFVHGNIRIGGPEAKPEFSTFSWVSMLFSAGLGIGLLYSGVYEPMSHYFKAPFIADLTGSKKFLGALDLTYFHWGLPAWVMYSSAGLMFAYTGFNLKKGFIFAAYIPENYKLIRDVVNIFAVLSILIGVIIAFALGVEQINAGLNEVFGSIPVNKANQVIIISIITLIATLSILSGLQKGIRLLSEINIWLALVLFFAVAISCVSTNEVLSISTQALGIHVSNFISELTFTASFEDKKWISDWTILYWAWWASWTPFVGLFIARISKGRTIKEFIFYTILIPSLMCFAWFSVFGLAGYQVHMAGIADFSLLINEAPHRSLFVVLNESLAPNILSIIAIFCIIIFYVTSSDSGSYVVDMITSGGKKAPHQYLKIYWSVIEGFLAIVLIFLGGIVFIKNLVIIFSLPLIFYLCFGIYKLDHILKKEPVKS